MPGTDLLVQGHQAGLGVKVVFNECEGIFTMGSKDTVVYRIKSHFDIHEIRIVHTVSKDPVQLIYPGQHLVLLLCQLPDQPGIF